MIELNDIIIRAVSVGGLETCIEIPKYKLCFDIGRCPPTAARLPRVFFTHAHCDHMGGVVMHCAMRNLWGMSPPEYLLPEENLADFQVMMDAWRRLDRSDLPCEVRSVAPGDRVTLTPLREIAVFRAVHRVPSLGYAIIHKKRRLREEFRGSTGREIADARHAGVVIEDTEEEVSLAFCGDTTIDVVKNEPMVRKAKVLVLEVTFLDDRVSREASRKKGHIHLDDILECADLFENEHLLFTHASSRYSPHKIQEILAARLPDSLLERVVPLLPGPPWLSDGR